MKKRKNKEIHCDKLGEIYTRCRTGEKNVNIHRAVLKNILHKKNYVQLTKTGHQILI